VRARRQDLKKIEDLGAILEEHLILDNRYTEHRFKYNSILYVLLELYLTVFVFLYPFVARWD